MSLPLSTLTTFGDDYISGTNSANTLIGDAGSDTLVGLSGDDTLLGGSGDDTLEGNYGNDTLRGGMGDDTLNGGLGADIIHGGFGNDNITATEDDILVTGDAGFDILKVRDSSGDQIVDVDMTSGTYRGFEALVGDFDRAGGDEVSLKISLDQILNQSKDDGDASTPDADNTFIAVGIDSLLIANGRNWNEGGDYNVIEVDLDATAEAAYLEMIGLERPNTDLHSYTFTKGSGEHVTIITDLSLEDITDASTGEDLSADLPA
ncbi:calcium-binding protein [uncultured Amphritea sp.]|uniref:calcium-binding protein n=1 Tax=uncultured Amphritea sp. TaxID=981605 RepID=UPI00262F9DA7|nr:calcium-binding protein [uncultured Amphritea sp.]